MDTDTELIARLLWRADGWPDEDFEEKGETYRMALTREKTAAERVLVAEVRRLRHELEQARGR